MPKELALLLCSGFVIYLLRLDRKQSVRISSALWIPTLWLFSIGTKPIGIWIPMSWGDGNSSLLDQFFGIGLFVCGLIVLTSREFSWSNFYQKYPWLFIFVGFMLLSCFWADSTFVCFKRGVRQVIAIIMAAIVLSEEDPIEAVKSILRRFSFILIPYSLLLIKYYRHLGIEYGRWSGEPMWIGVALQKNGLARVCITALLFMIWQYFCRDKTKDTKIGKYGVMAEFFVIFLGLYLLFPEGKSSATSLIAFFVGMVAFFGSRYLWKRGYTLSKLLPIGLMSVMAFGAALPLTGGSIGNAFNPMMGRDTTFTGRADVWPELVLVAMEHPILGVGFDSYWSPQVRDLHRMSHAHNAYLEIFIEMGAVGLFLFAMFVLSVGKAARRFMTENLDWGALCIGYLFASLIHGAAESSINSFSTQLLSVLLLLSITVLTPTRVGGISANTKLAPANILLKNIKQ